MVCYQQLRGLMLWRYNRGVYVRCALTVVVFSAWVLAQSAPPSCPAERPVDDIIRGAAAVDAEIAAFRTKAQEHRFRNVRQLVSWLAANGPLKEGLTEEEAAAIVWTLTSPEVHRLLRVNRGWPPERYTAWLRDTLTGNLLR